MRLAMLTIAAMLAFTTLAQAQCGPFGCFSDRQPVRCTTVPDGAGGYITVCR
jgi:hypothetical protein